MRIARGRTARDDDRERTMAERPTRTTQPWVLVAEDDEEMRELVARMLRRDGFAVLEVGSGTELQRTMESCCTRGDPPAMVISDIRMPGLSGLEVLSTIREWGLTFPVIMITAFADEETLISADYLGATAVLDKPFDMDELRDAVKFLSRYPFRAAGRGSR